MMNGYSVSPQLLYICMGVKIFSSNSKHTMKKISWALCFVCVFISVLYSQPASKGIHPYSLSGVIIDSVSQEPIVGVTVMIVPGENKKNTIGTISGKKGEFLLENIKTTNPSVHFSAIGYKTKIIDTIQGGKSSAINLGTIRMQQGAVQMNAVEIKAARPMIEFLPDKQVINMEQVPGASGNVTDALRNTGAVDVDPQSNKISIRGRSGVNIMLDGKPLPNAEELLTQMPASMIDQVEITTNPSAKDDPEGDAGIINFITKKGYSDNYSGSFTVYANNKNMKYAAAFINYRKSKMNLYGSLNGGLGKFASGLNYTKTFYQSSAYHTLRSDGDQLREGFMLNGKVGLDYDLDDMNSLSVTANYFHMKGTGHNNGSNIVFDSTGTARYSYQLNNGGALDNNTYSGTATYKKKFDKKGNELSADVYYSRLTYDAPNDLSTQYSYTARPILQHAKSFTGNKTLIAKLDWADPTWSLGKIDAGYNYTFRDRSTDYNYSDYIDSLDLWQRDSAYSNYFKYRENIHAVYSNFGNKILGIDYRLGIRLEKILSTGTVVTTNQNFALNYTSVFPSLLLSYNLSERLQLTFNLARRIRRPQMEYINPFKRINGPNDLSIGNPALQPTYTNLYELAINPIVKVYYTKSTGRPVSITALMDDTISVTSMVNNASTKTFGVELMLPIINDSKFPISLPSWFSMGNISYTYSRIQESSDYLTESYDINRTAWNLNANLVLKPYDDINAIFSYRYTPRISDARTVTNKKSILTFTLSKEFFDKKLRVAIIASDILKANMSRTETFSPNYYMDNRWTNFNSQNIAIAFTYKFNDFKAQQERQIDDGRDRTEGGIF